MQYEKGWMSLKIVISIVNEFTYVPCTYITIQHNSIKCWIFHWFSGRLSRLRTLQVSNKGLYNIGLAAGLAHISFSHPFNPLENWLPCCYMVGKASSSEEHGMSDYDSSSSDQYEISKSAIVVIRILFTAGFLVNTVLCFMVNEIK